MFLSSWVTFYNWIKFLIFNLVIVFGIHSKLTYDSEAYDIVKLCLSLDSSFFST